MRAQVLEKLALGPLRREVVHGLGILDSQSCERRRTVRALVVRNEFLGRGRTRCRRDEQFEYAVRSRVLSAATEQ